MREKHTEFVFNTAHCGSIFPSQAALRRRAVPLAQGSDQVVLEAERRHRLALGQPPRRRECRDHRGAKAHYERAAQVSDLPLVMLEGREGNPL